MIRLIDYQVDGTHTLSGNVKKTCTYAVLEPALGGEIFDFIVTGAFPQSIARLYFGKLIKGLKKMHEQGIYHRDLKPENILLDSNLDLKIADFGLSKNISEMDGSITTRTFCGTRPYMAPELLAGKPYEPPKVDVFAAGAILFNFYSGYRGFDEASLKNPFYNFLMQGRPDSFWRLHDRKMKDIPGFFTDDFKTLFIHMVDPNPETRATLEQIK